MTKQKRDDSGVPARCGGKQRSLQRGARLWGDWQRRRVRVRKHAARTEQHSRSADMPSRCRGVERLRDVLLATRHRCARSGRRLGVRLRVQHLAHPSGLLLRLCASVRLCACNCRVIERIRNSTSTRPKLGRVVRPQATAFSAATAAATVAAAAAAAAAT